MNTSGSAVVSTHNLLDLASIARTHLGPHNSEKLYPTIYKAAVEKWPVKKFHQAIENSALVGVSTESLRNLAAELATCVESQA